MIFFLVLLASMFLSVVVQHFIGPIQPFGARVMLMPIIMFYGALAMPVWGMLALAFAGGLMWDALCTQQTKAGFEVALGWSVLLYAALGAIMSGFRPLFQRGRWEIHCLLSGLCTSAIVFAEFVMISVRRQPLTFVFNQEVWWRIGGAGLIAALISPLFFFFLNYLALLVGYDPQPERKAGH
ncbi:MAG: hypothetical protein JWL59_1524 [Chthoniobacteraceae bacterium]|nr:hypothetical protein [Chthoniobacteraceae bacterium]